MYPKITPKRSHEKYVELLPNDPNGLERRDGTWPCGGTLHNMGFIFSRLLGLEANNPNAARYPVMKMTDRSCDGWMSPRRRRKAAIMGGRLLKGVLERSAVVGFSFSDLAAERRMAWMAWRTRLRLLVVLLVVAVVDDEELLVSLLSDCTTSTTPPTPGESMASRTVGGSSPLANESVI